VDVDEKRINNRRWLEVALVIAFYFGPMFYAGYSNYLAPRPPLEDVPNQSVAFWYDAIYIYVLSGISIALVGSIIFLSREPLSTFGIVRFRARRDLGYGLLAMVVGLFLYWIYDILTWQVVEERPVVDFGLSHASGWLILVGALAMVANSCAEELTSRGFMLVRLEQLLGSTKAALAISTALFASYHIYYGFVGMGGIAVVGLAYGLSFTLTRSLWVPIVAHTLTNLYSFSFVWLGLY
jgi:uncharacterized protein